MTDRIAILQFGTSRFLLAHADLFISQALEKGEAIGKIAVVQTTSNPDSARRIEALNKGDGYPVRMRGIRAGQQVDENLRGNAVAKAFSAAQDWAAIAELALDVDVILSNTGDRGFELDASDGAALVESFDNVPKSFPAKILVLLHNRWRQRPESRLTLFPCELISRNGDQLRAIVKTLATNWGLSSDFIEWSDQNCHFANSLVDRIVSQPIDPVGAICEPYGLWAIDAADGMTLPCTHPAIVVTDDLESYERLKLQILNLGHSYLAERWLKDARNQDETVREAMQDDALRGDLETVWREEVLPVFAADGLEDAARVYIEEVKDRFLNPFLDHRIGDIASNHEEKKQRRLKPVVERAEALGLALAQPRLKAAL